MTTGRTIDFILYAREYNSISSGAIFLYWPNQKMLRIRSCCAIDLWGSRKHGPELYL